jgi:N-acetylneuraminate synthase
MRSEVVIAGRKIGPGHPPFVVAELSGNHTGQIERAFELLEHAKVCGAEAVKLQTYTPDTITIDHDGADFRITSGPWQGRHLYELYGEAHTPWDWHSVLFERARELGLIIFSTPFDFTAVDFLESLNPPAYKIASFELQDLPLVRHIAATRRPTIMSTGMASEQEIDEAVEAFRSAGGTELILLHCVSGYPTPIDQSNLLRIPALIERYGCPVGLSDHTLGTEAALAAVALRAAFVEKHFTKRRSDGGPDAAFSLEPNELAQLVTGTRGVFAALGTGSSVRAEVEEASMVFRRSIYAVQDIGPGRELTAENIRSIRPGYGLSPKHLPKILGRRARVAIARGTPLSWDLVE